MGIIRFVRLSAHLSYFGIKKGYFRTLGGSRPITYVHAVLIMHTLLSTINLAKSDATYSIPKTPYVVLKNIRSATKVKYYAQPYVRLV